MVRGTGLGDSIRLDAHSTIGGVPMPTRPTFVIGQAHMRIIDHEEYLRTRDHTRNEFSLTIPTSNTP